MKNQKSHTALSPAHLVCSFFRVEDHSLVFGSRRMFSDLHGLFRRTDWTGYNTVSLTTYTELLWSYEVVLSVWLTEQPADEHHRNTRNIKPYLLTTYTACSLDNINIDPYLLPAYTVCSWNPINIKPYILTTHKYPFTTAWRVLKLRMDVTV